jgi:hypothetical protein
MGRQTLWYCGWRLEITRGREISSFHREVNCSVNPVDSATSKVVSYEILGIGSTCLEFTLTPVHLRLKMRSSGLLRSVVVRTFDR